MYSFQFHTKFSSVGRLLYIPSPQYWLSSSATLLLALPYCPRVLNLSRKTIILIAFCVSPNSSYRSIENLLSHFQILFLRWLYLGQDRIRCLTISILPPYLYSLVQTRPIAPKYPLKLITQVQAQMIVIIRAQGVSLYSSNVSLYGALIRLKSFLLQGASFQAFIYLFLNLAFIPLLIFIYS